MVGAMGIRSADLFCLLLSHFSMSDSDMHIEFFVGESPAIAHGQKTSSRQLKNNKGDHGTSEIKGSTSTSTAPKSFSQADPPDTASLAYDTAVPIDVDNLIA